MEQEVKPVDKTIDIEKAGKQWKVRVRVLPVEWEGEKKEVVIKKLTFGERADFVDKFMKVQIIGDMRKADVSLKNMQIQTLLMCLHEAPFPITEDFIQNGLDGSLGEIIHKECEEFNQLNVKKK